ncbi:hypothetical protein [Nostoc sp. UHCC 0252]|nr:hypothetical protein [Nostoc sp. UHCC 0252]MEA5604805.1 hypothetical protein [Nostoc sp. UHCC 0252]
MADFDPYSRKLQILGKTKGTNDEFVALSHQVAQAIADVFDLNV